MGFKASFLFVICLLILGYVLASSEEKPKKPKEQPTEETTEPTEETTEEPKVDNGRRAPKDVEKFTCDDQCLSWLHNNSRDDLADESTVPRSGDITVRAFFLKHIPLVEKQRFVAQKKPWRECSAIWVVKGTLAGFNYDPPHPKSRQKPWVDHVYTAAPPRNGVNENYLLARPEEWWPSSHARKAQKIHAEWILNNQVVRYNDLKAYTYAQTPIDYVMMYTVWHPCGPCAHHLVEILNKIKAENNRRTGGTLALPCHLAYREQYSSNDDDVNTNILAVGGITRLAKLPGVGQKLQ